MKKKNLISLGTTLAAGMLLVACAQSTTTNHVVGATNGITDEQEESNPNSGDSDIRNVTIHLRGAKIDEGGEGDKVVIKTRRGTRWRAIKNMAPQKTSITYPEPEYITDLFYTYTEQGTRINDSNCINEDTDLYLNLQHEQYSGEDKCHAIWRNDDGSEIEDDESVFDYYRPGEHPYFKGVTPRSTNDENLKFVGWGPTDPQSQQINTNTDYTALYAYNTLEVNFHYNYPEGDDPIHVQEVTTDGSGVAHARELLPEPTHKGYTFSGWYEEPTCEHPFIFDDHQIVDDSTKIFAKWDATTVSVTVDPNGGTFEESGEDQPQTIDTAYATTWAEFSSEEEGGRGAQIKIGTLPPGAKNDYTYKRFDNDTLQWVDIDPDYVIDSSIMIKAFYEYKTVTLMFSDDYEGATEIPDEQLVDVGTKWSDIKADCQITGIKDGYHFDHYYIDNGEEEEPTVIDDDFVFEGEDESTVIFHVSYNVDITFDNNPDYGIIDFKMASLPTGTFWRDISRDYEPQIVYEPYMFIGYSDEFGILDYEYKIHTPATFTANYSFAEGDSFTDDSWDVFTNYVHGKSYEDLTGDSELPYYEEWYEHGETFVGLTRDIEIYGNTYQVRVVDENKNAEGDEELFTFEFVQTLDLPLPFSLDMDNNDYQDSLLNNYLNNYFIYSLPKPLLENDALVDKELKSFAPSSLTDETYNAKVFLPSASQLGFTQYPDSDPIHDEGAVFAYYDGKSAEDRVKTIGDTSNNANYWLRSPDITGALETAWTVNDSGNLGDEDGNIIAINSADIYFAPAFAIK